MLSAPVALNNTGYDNKNFLDLGIRSMGKPENSCLRLTYLGNLRRESAINSLFRQHRQIFLISFLLDQ